ncbi:peptidase [Desulfocucumis palustris]|uniref:Prepilin leader peptidase/N-methyltransferase n=1 Tax=Desulfocucumis palustris TaxID=1898651 RepID=A0A2L2X9N2_9FIRM|nr:A24 family peptidase [Desulfocucumis palustris]GBF32752.1 peptidase [Desulfocucumis palustris]
MSGYDGIILFFTGMLGLIAGSFINVCIYRIPLKESILFPPSHCPNCQKKIKIYDLLPVISYLLLRGRCRFCGERIGIRYPLVEIITGMLFMALLLKFALTPVLLKYAVLTCILVIVTFIDLEHYIIPNGVVLAGLAAGILLHYPAGDVTLMSSLYGILSSAGFLLFVYILSLLIFKQEGMGLGDVKLSLVMGLFLGWPLSIMAIFLACCFAGGLGIFLLLLKKKARGDIIPFGPFLAMGALTSLMWGKQIIEWYAKTILHIS